MRVPLVRRREILKALLPKEGPIRLSDAIEEHGIEFFRAARTRGGERVEHIRPVADYVEFICSTDN